MPGHHRSIKSMFFDVVVFVGMFALLGHLSINFWERFVIQTELTSMKTSLHSLRETINKIGYAYDNLHRELIGLAEISLKKSLAAPERKEPDPPRKKIKYLDQTFRDVQSEATIQAKNHTTSPMHCAHKTVQNCIQSSKKNKTTQNTVQEIKKILRPSGKNMSTITKYPAKSTGVGLQIQKSRYDCPNEEYCRYRSCTNIHRCCKDYDSYNRIDQLKF